MPPASFASRLDEALIAAPWSLDRIVEMLAEQDLHISQATLSHWRSGRSAPKRHNSFRIVAALEEILEMAPQSLSSILGQNSAMSSKTSTHYFAPPSGKEPQPVDSKFTDYFEEADTATDWTHEIKREVLKKKTVISADFLTQTHTFTVLARIPQTKNPCLHISTGLDDTAVIPEIGYVDVYNVEGATIGERQLYANGRTTVTRLDLPNSCYPGELHRISFTYSYLSTVPLTESSFQAFSWPLLFYINHIEFEGDIPQHIEWVEETIHEEADTAHSSTAFLPVFPIGNTAQICIEKPKATYGFFRWK